MCWTTNVLRNRDKLLRQGSKGHSHHCYRSRKLNSTVLRLLTSGFPKQSPSVSFADSCRTLILSLKKPVIPPVPRTSRRFASGAWQHPRLCGALILDIWFVAMSALIPKGSYLYVGARLYSTHNEVHLLLDLANPCQRQWDDNGRSIWQWHRQSCWSCSVLSFLRIWS